MTAIRGKSHVAPDGTEAVPLSPDSWTTTQEIADLGTGGGGTIQSVTVELDATEIATLFSVPVELIPAPGAGFAIRLLQVTVQYVPGVVGWVVLDAIRVYYTDLSTPGLTQATAALLDPAPAALIADLFVSPLPISAGVPTADADDAPVVIGSVSGNPVPVGSIVTSTLGDGGADYAVGDTGTIIDPLTGSSAATYVVSTVGALGVVTALAITAAGISYSARPADNPKTTAPGGAQPGIGNGLTVNVTAIPPADGVLWVTALYHTVTVN